MQIRTFTGGGFGENAYLAVCEETGACVAVDPGSGAPMLVRTVEAEGFDLEAVLLTHAHLDHIEGVSDVHAAHPDVPIWLHPDDLALYRGVQRQAAMFGLSVDAQPEPTDELIPGETVGFGLCSFDIAFAPGHAPGERPGPERRRHALGVEDVLGPPRDAVQRPAPRGGAAVVG